jgi:sugar phosphate isomerase/epimerase
MRFGCCVQPDQIALLAQAGYDFCELPARAVLPFEDDTAALPALRAIAAAPLRPEAFNVLVPPELPLVGPRADVGALRSYVRRAFQRMAQLGGAVVVVGSGGARQAGHHAFAEKRINGAADDTYQRVIDYCGTNTYTRAALDTIAALLPGRSAETNGGKSVSKAICASS